MTHTFARGGPPEAPWERVMRRLFGWAFAAVVGFTDRVVRLVPDSAPEWAPLVIVVGLMVFFVSMAHSTVAGIVLSNLTGAIRRIWFRGARDRRSGPRSTTIERER